MADAETGTAARSWLHPKTLANALWFPLFFVVGFMVFYLLPFHSPAPNDTQLAVAGQQQAATLSTQLQQHSPGAFDVDAVHDAGQARQAVQDRNADAAYDPASATLYVAKANGQSLTQTMQQTFTPVAQSQGQQLHVVDLAPTASGDTTGTGLFYILMVANLAGYITVMMLLQATAIEGNRKLGVLAGFGLLASVLAFVFGASMHVLPVNFWMIPLLFLLTQAVGWVTLGLASFVGRFIPGVAMGLFVLLSIPSSSGAIPVQMVPGFFQALHTVMPLGNAVDAARGILYFGGTGLTRPLLVLAAWFIAGIGLIALSRVRANRAATAVSGQVEGEAAPERTPTAAIDGDAATETAPAAAERAATVMVGNVTDGHGRPISKGTVTLTDHRGIQLGSASLTPEGSYAHPLDGLAPQYLTAVVLAPHYRSAADRVPVGHEPITRLDFALLPKHPAREEQPAPGRASAPARAR